MIRFWMLGAAVLAAASVVWNGRPHEDDFAATVRGLRPSVALVTVVAPAAERNRRAEEDEVYGTAEVVASSARGSTLLTAYHVIDQARRITIRLDDGRTFPARVFASDRGHDAALLRTPVPGLPPVAFAHTTGLEAGDPVGVLGFPIPDAFEDQHLGTALSSYAGRIASVRRGALELDLPIIPGESGGPVFDAGDGAVIGIAESRFDDERAIGFATPVEELAPLLKKAL